VCYKTSKEHLNGIDNRGMTSAETIMMQDETQVVVDWTSKARRLMENKEDDVHI